MNRFRMSALLGAITAIIVLSQNSTLPPQFAKANDNGKEEELAKLQQEVQLLKDKASDQAHAMVSVDYHYTNLWFAGKAENWPLADFYWKESLSHMRWAVRIIPVRKDNAGKEVKLKEILESIEMSPFMQMGKVIEQRSSAEFELTYGRILEGCYSCHKAADKPYLRLRIPDRPATSIIHFEPMMN